MGKFMGRFGDQTRPTVGVQRSDQTNMTDMTNMRNTRHVRGGERSVHDVDVAISPPGVVVLAIAAWTGRRR
jgi:hypothetical protein